MRHPLPLFFSVLVLFWSPTLLQGSEVPAELLERQTQLDNAVAGVAEAIVGVFDGTGIGSGVIVSSDGYVLTASHVVSGSVRRRSRRQPSTVTIYARGGKKYSATVLGRNADADAALLKISSDPPGSGGFPFAQMGKTTETTVGEWCFAAGHPGGFDEDREAPIRIGRVLSVGSRTVVSDCAILPGDSGGPLFNLKGEVIGIHSMITSLIIENRHVTIDSFHNDWDRLLNGDRWGRLRDRDNTLTESPFFGVLLTWPEFVPTVSQTLPDSPARKAGLEPGDKLVSIAGSRIADRLDLGTTLALLEENQSVDITFERDGVEQQVKLQTGYRDQQDGELDEEIEAALEQQREREILEQLSDNRPIGRNEKRSAEQLRLFADLAREHSGGIVAIRDNALLVCLGTVVSEDGYILTKASELKDTREIYATFPQGGRANLSILARDASFDIALLKADVGNRRLRPVSFRQTPAAVGELALLQDPRGRPAIPTVISVAPHAMPDSGVAFLGVQPMTTANGVSIEAIVSGGAAERSGLEQGDIILALNNQPLQSDRELINRIAAMKPGDEVAVRLMRDEEIMTIDVELTSRFIHRRILPLYGEDELQGQYSSVYAGGFPRVLEIDADVYPSKVGGPLLGLNGEAMGIVIARADRYPTYVIPADSVQEILAKLLQKAELSAEATAP